jgi:hypothetical protein
MSRSTFYSISYGKLAVVLCLLSLAVLLRGAAANVGTSPGMASLRRRSGNGVGFVPSNPFIAPNDEELEFIHNAMVPMKSGTFAACSSIY